MGMNHTLGTLSRAMTIAIATVIFAFAFQGPTFADEKLTITAGSPGGGYFRAAAAFAEYIKKDIPGTAVTVIPGGGWTNVERLQPASKLADIAVVENAIATMAERGTGPNGKKYDIRMLASIRGPSVAQASIVESLGIKSIEEIAEKKYPIRIATFERHQHSTAQVLQILEAYGLTQKKINSWGGKVIFTSANEGIRMIMDGQADMWFAGASLIPDHKLIQLGAKKAFRVLPISKDIADKVSNKYGLETIKVPAGIYDKNNGKNEAYYSPAVIVAFGIRTAVSDDLAYKLTKALANHKDEFWAVHKQHRFYKPALAWKNIGTAKLHPGAAKYYKEMGYMK